jgi:RNA-splicing ligase RtcB
VDQHKGINDYRKERARLIEKLKARGEFRKIQPAIEELKRRREHTEPDMPEDLCYLSGELFCDYLHDVEICQQFARRNRELMAEIILDRTGMKGTDAFHTIHNYIDTKEMILRKGAIAAHEGEKVLIPINMRDGSILAVGKGNPEWNFSAPHGAGRVMSRKAAMRDLTMEEYRESMKGIYTTSVNEGTLDEAPMAYKSLEDILDVVKASVDVLEVLRPIYNFKATEEMMFR